MTDANPEATPFITFYSYKGGVGRSMAVLNVAALLAADGFRVLIIDFDLEAPGLTHLYQQVKGAKNDKTPPGVVDLLYDARFKGGDSDLIAHEKDFASVLPGYTFPVSVPAELKPVAGGSVSIMPSGRTGPDYTTRFANLDLGDLYKQGVGPGLIQHFKQVIAGCGLYDYVLIDSRTGLSEEAGICTRDLADHLMVVSGFNRQNLVGTATFLASLRAALGEEEAKRKTLDIILSPVPIGEEDLLSQCEQEAAKLFQKAWGRPFSLDLSIPYHPRLALTESAYVTSRTTSYLKTAYVEIESRLLKSLGHLAGQLFRKAGDAIKAGSGIVALRLLRQSAPLARKGNPRRGSPFPPETWNRYIDLSQADTLASFCKLPEAASILEVLAALPVSPYYLLSVAEALSEENDEMASIVERAILSLDDLPAGFFATYAAKLTEQKHRIKTAGFFHLRAIELAPEDARLLGNYANFLADVCKDFDTAEALYERAIDADPNHANNLGNYATFLSNDREDFDAAEALYKRALNADPKHANHLGNYATFLKNVRKNFDAAEALYKRAIEAAPNHAGHLGNYATFLKNVRKDFDAAEALYKRAIEAAPNHAGHLGNYANFLAEVRKDLDAAESLYKRAIDADPNHANHLGNYATFLENVRKDFDAAESLYKRAIDADPNHANHLGNYAVFLSDNRKDFDAAEAFYKRAIDADPTHVDNLGNYAVFLSDDRKDFDAAEALYKRAINTDPTDANYLGIYAAFLKNVRKDFEASEALYKRALNADPKHADNLGNYAIFLADVCKDFDAAEALYKRAIDADPTHADNLGNYATFLSDDRKDFDAAEALYKRAIDAAPADANHLGNYATFLSVDKKDFDAAEALYKRAIDADPNHANNLSNYGQFLIGSYRMEFGLSSLREAWRHRDASESGGNAELAYSLWLATCLSDAEEPAWEQIFKFYITSGFPRHPWSFERMLAIAKEILPPADYPYAAALAAAFLDESAVAALDSFPRWRSLQPLDPAQANPDGSIVTGPSSAVS